MKMNFVQVKMNFVQVELVEMVRDIFEQLEKKASKRGTVMLLKPRNIKSVFVLADAQRLSQVLTNLIENGIKYGKDAGKVVVELTEENKKVLISVEDDGPGIPAEFLPRIFERFFRVDKSRSRETGGTGLGLAIVKHILNAHNTTINVTSKIDKGTRFTFTLTRPMRELAINP